MLALPYPDRSGNNARRPAPTGTAAFVAQRPFNAKDAVAYVVDSNCVTSQARPYSILPPGRARPVPEPRYERKDPSQALGLYCLKESQEQDAICRNRCGCPILNRK